LYSVDASAYICPLCKKNISHTVADIFGFLYEGTPEKYLEYDINNTLVKFNDIEDYDSKITLDGYTYSNLREQLLNKFEIDGVSHQYGSGKMPEINNTQDVSTAIDMFSNGFCLLNLYPLISDEDSSKFIMIDENVRQLAFHRKISEIDLYEDEDEVGYSYYTTLEEYPTRKFIKYVGSSILMQFMIYAQMLNLPYFTSDNIHKMWEPIQDYKDESFKEVSCALAFINNLSYRSLEKYIEKGIQLDVSDTELVKLFSIASIYNGLSALGHTEFGFNSDIIEQITGLTKEEITSNPNAPKEAIDLLAGNTKFSLISETFRSFLMLKDKDLEILNVLITEQQSYIANNVEIL